MAKSNEAVPSVRVPAFLVPPASAAKRPLPIGLVEDAGFPSQFMSELFMVLGESRPPSGVVNFSQGQVNVNGIFLNDPNVLNVVRPTQPEFALFEAFDILIVDPKDKLPLVMAQGCFPQSLSVQATGGRAVRFQYNGICKGILYGAEITASKKAAA